MKIILGCEESQAVTIEMRKKGHEAYSCDLKPCSGGHPEWHIIADILTVINGGCFNTQSGITINIERWDMGIFFPDCTYLTNSAAWAYKEPPYHQKTKAGTLTGLNRVKAREQAIDFVYKIWNSHISDIAIENPIGILSTVFQKPSQIIHPYMFGDDASKATCLWLRGLPILQTTEYVEPRMVDGLKRWGNQTDSGQNKLPPTKNRAELRSKTFSGIAKAMASQWG